MLVWTASMHMSWMESGLEAAAAAGWDVLGRGVAPRLVQSWAASAQMHAFLEAALTFFAAVDSVGTVDRGVSRVIGHSSGFCGGAFDG